MVVFCHQLPSFCLNNDNGHRKDLASSSNDSSDSIQARVLKSMEKKLKDLCPLYGDDHCIYRVDQKFRKINPDAYNPMMVSIGPFHHKQESLSAMEEYKLRCLNTFLERTKIDLQVYIEHMHNLLDETRKCYAESTIKLPDDAFVEMMLLDGLFIIDLLQKYPYPKHKIDKRHKDIYPLLNNSWIISSLKHDILLLENQLPMCVLDDLFKLTKTYPAGSSSHPISIIPDDGLNRNDGIFKSSPVSERLMQFLDQLIMKKPYNLNVPAPKAKHLLDLLGKTLHPSPEPERPSDQVDQTGTTSKSVPCVKDLTLAGVKFEVSTSDRLLDIEFDKGTFKIPPIFIDDLTDTVLRNLIAYEQCSHEKLTYMVSYAYFMDSLINSVEDVAILREKGIIKSDLGNDREVCDLFNKLCNQTTLAIVDFHYSNLSDKVYEYYNSNCHRYIAILKRDYFQNPWTIISFVAAVLLLLLTATQSVTSILQVI